MTTKMKKSDLDQKLNQLLDKGEDYVQENIGLVFDICLEYFDRISDETKKRLLVWQSSFKPRTISKVLFEKLCNVLGYDPYEPECWDFEIMDKIVGCIFKPNQIIELKFPKSKSKKKILKEIENQMGCNYDGTYIYSFSLECPNGDVCNGYIYPQTPKSFVLNSKLYEFGTEYFTFVCRDEQDGIICGRCSRLFDEGYSVSDIVDVYLESLE